MTTDRQALTALWMEAFGDPREFVDSFFATGFSEDRFQCIRIEGAPIAALYWFDCRVGEQNLAYIYAVAVDKNHRGKGLCRSLMAQTHRHLKQQGYAGAIVVPARAELAQLYAKLGYRHFGGITTLTCQAGKPVPLTPLTAQQYAQRRRQYLPPQSVLQEGAALTYLQTFSGFYAGDGFVLGANELLGDTTRAPGIVAALGKQTMTLHTPGTEPYAMYHPFTNAPPPAYFGLALD